MNTVIASLVLDLVVTAMLAATIIYCTKLNRRIRILQDSKSELAQLIQQFDESTQLATRSINEIHSVSKKINESIKAKLDKANYIVDDLTFMIDKGNKLADRMEADISGARKQQPSSVGTARAARGGASAEAELTPPAEEKAVERAAAAMPMPRKAASQTSGDEQRGRRAGLESMLEKIAQKKAASGGEAPAAPPSPSGANFAPGGSPARKLRTSAKLRSKAEQELYDALKSDKF